MSTVAQSGCRDHRSNQEREDVLKSQVKLVQHAGVPLPNAPTNSRVFFSQRSSVFVFAVPPVIGRGQRAILTRHDHCGAAKSKFYKNDLEWTVTVWTKIRLLFTDIHEQTLPHWQPSIGACAFSPPLPAWIYITFDLEPLVNARLSAFAHSGIPSCRRKPWHPALRPGRPSGNRFFEKIHAQTKG